MRNFDKMFDTEQKRLDIKKDLAENKAKAEREVVKDFCNDGLFDFLRYLDDKYYIRKHSINFHVDGEVYLRSIVENVDEIYRNNKFISGINYKWSNGGHYDTLKVECIDFKAILTYEGERMDLDTFIETVVRQITEAKNKATSRFKILEVL